MLTTQEILALPNDQLPETLKAYGLLPPGVIAAHVLFQGLWMQTRDGYATWHPQRWIAHAWPLVEIWGLTIERSHDFTQGAWWVGQWGSVGCYAAIFVDIPATICRAVLMLEIRRYSTREYEERHDVS